MTKVTLSNSRPTINANGVKAPVQPRIVAKNNTITDTKAQLKRVTTKHREAFSLLAKR